MSALAPDRLARQIAEGDTRSLARAITAVTNDEPIAAELLQAIAPYRAAPICVGFTGPPGAGKSTLINAYVRELRKNGKTVAVAAVDPSSAFHGGAVLGDRIRMGEHSNDPGVYVRSLAARGHYGGLTATILGVLDLLAACGRDVIILETVGAGQSEIDIAEIADVRVVIAAPGLGDDVQALKAGILEIADLIVVNKADKPGAKRTYNQLKAGYALRDGAVDTPIVMTVATEGQGIGALTDTIDAKAPAALSANPELRAARRARRVLAEALAAHVKTHVLTSRRPEVDSICRRLACRAISIDEALAELAGPLGRDD